MFKQRPARLILIIYGCCLTLALLFPPLESLRRSQPRSRTTLVTKYLHRDPGQPLWSVPYWKSVQVPNPNYMRAEQREALAKLDSDLAVQLLQDTSEQPKTISAPRKHVFGDVDKDRLIAELLALSIVCGSGLLIVRTLQNPA